MDRTSIGALCIVSALSVGEGCATIERHFSGQKQLSEAKILDITYDLRRDREYKIGSGSKNDMLKLNYRGIDIEKRILVEVENQLVVFERMMLPYEVIPRKVMVIPISFTPVGNDPYGRLIMEVSGIPN